MEKKMSGSETAKSGFQNEHDIVSMLNDWQGNQQARNILSSMGYEEVSSVQASKIPGSVKPDIRVVVNGETNYASLKKYRADANYNHVCRTSVDNYANKFGFNDSIADALKVFTGEIKPADKPEVLATKPARDKRATLKELVPSKVDEIIEFFDENRERVLRYIFCGDDKDLEPKYMIITKEGDGTPTYTTMEMNRVVDYYKQYPVDVSARGSIQFGSVILQRKGGQGSPENLQFKFRPDKIVKLLEQERHENS
tara:strand:+ start:12282 stop:13043 length:762 start_codon:yes stop_codon:yes gene_type:complete